MEINYIDADTNVCFYDVDTRLADDRNDCNSSLDSCTVWNYVWDSQIFWDPQSSWWSLWRSSKWRSGGVKQYNQQNLHNLIMLLDRVAYLYMSQINFILFKIDKLFTHTSNYMPVWKKLIWWYFQYIAFLIKHLNFLWYRVLNIKKRELFSDRIVIMPQCNVL